MSDLNGHRSQCGILLWRFLLLLLLLLLRLLLSLPRIAMKSPPHKAHYEANGIKLEDVSDYYVNTMYLTHRFLQAQHVVKL